MSTNLFNHMNDKQFYNLDFLLLEILIPPLLMSCIEYLHKLELLKYFR